MQEHEAELIHENVAEIKKELPNQIVLCAVTKYHDLDETIEVIKNGVTDLGENKVQDLVKKMDAIDLPVNWHFIGHLQTNKVKFLIGRVSLIQSVDSVKVLRKIDTESKKQNVNTKVLIQYNLTGEDQKYGFSEEETQNWLQAMQELDNVEVCGIMGMGPHTEDKEEIRKVFRQLKELYDRIDNDVDQNNVQMQILSMGMSGDYPIAVEEGATLVRIGSKLFN